MPTLVEIPRFVHLIAAREAAMRACRQCCENGEIQKGAQCIADWVDINAMLEVYALYFDAR